MILWAADGMELYYLWRYWLGYAQSTVNRQKKNLKLIKKFCLRNLQTGKYLQKIDSCEVIQCCSCGASNEDDDHLFQCKVISTFLKCIQKELKKYKNELDLKLYHLLLDDIYTYVHGPSHHLYEHASFWNRKVQRRTRPKITPTLTKKCTRNNT